ncbi:MAG: SPFH domain-containing protein [Myxococcota bacterium]|nr:SPFH domain-containing protein [Myxococcota bacterium]
MGLWDKIKSQLIEIIEYMEDDHETLVWRFPVRAQEIKNGAKLVVREGQSAIFINEGKLADVFEPGTYTLTTQNLPILATLKGWKYGFNSPFKAEVYFVNKTNVTNIKWGTQNPIPLRDPEFGPVRLRAFGSFAVKISDAAKFMREVVGTDGHFEMDEISGQLKRALLSKFTTALGQAKIPLLDLAANYEDVAAKIKPQLDEDFEPLGLSLSMFYIENISLPPKVSEMLDRRSEMSILGNMQEYAAYQTANAIPDAAKAPNSMAGAGMGLAAGMAMGGNMAGMMMPGMMPGMMQPGMMQPGMMYQQPGMAPAAAPAPAPAPAASGGGDDMVTRLKKLDALKAAGVLSEEEYQSKRGEILASI